MTLGLVGRKVGMTRIFTDDGDSLPVTVLDVSDNRITQRDGGIEDRLARAVEAFDVNQLVDRTLAFRDGARRGPFLGLDLPAGVDVEIKL